MKRNAESKHRERHVTVTKLGQARTPRLPYLRQTAFSRCCSTWEDTLLIISISKIVVLVATLCETCISLRIDSGRNTSGDEGCHRQNRPDTGNMPCLVQMLRKLSPHCAKRSAVSSSTVRDGHIVDAIGAAEVAFGQGTQVTRHPVYHPHLDSRLLARPCACIPAFCSRYLESVRREIPR